MTMAQVALAWVLTNPIVSSPIVGATKPHHLPEAVAALDLRAHRGRGARAGGPVHAARALLVLTRRTPAAGEANDWLRSPGEEVLGRSRRPIGPRDSFEAGRPAVLSRAPVGAESVAPIARPVRRKGVPRARHPPIPATLSRGICGQADPGSRSACRCRVERGYGDPAGGAGEPLLRRERAARARLFSCGAARSAGARRSSPTAGGRASRPSTTPRPARSSTSTTTSRRLRSSPALRAVLGPVELPGRSVDDPLHTAQSRGQRDVLDLVRRPRRVAEGLRRRPQGRVQRRRAAVVAGRR